MVQKTAPIILSVCSMYEYFKYCGDHDKSNLTGPVMNFVKVQSCHPLLDIGNGTGQYLELIVMVSVVSAKCDISVHLVPPPGTGT